MPLVWNDTLATGMRQIDLQHQELIDLVNALEAALTAGHRQEALEEALPKLHAYVLFHFGTEEAMLPMAAASHAEMHRRQHQEFSARVAAMRAVPVKDIDWPELLDYLKRWLVEHIMKTDRDLARQILNKTASDLERAR